MNRHPATHKQNENKDRTWITLGLDWGERIAILVLYGWFAYRIIASYIVHGNMPNLILLFSEGVVVLLILIRRTTRDVSRRPAEWLLAFSAATAPLLVYPAIGRALLPTAVAAAVTFFGLLVQLSAKLILGRSMGLVPANRGVKLSGPYRLVRHPMYAGYLLTHIAFLLMNLTMWNLGVYVVHYALQIPRLLVEERLLRKDPRYTEYMASVRYRLFPGVF